MAMFPRPVSPLRAIGDLRAFLRTRPRYELISAIAALAVATVLMIVVWRDFTVTKAYDPPEITYVTQWPASRTAAEARAQQAIDGPREAAKKRADDAAALKRRQEFQRLADRLGIK